MQYLGFNREFESDIRSEDKDRTLRHDKKWLPEEGDVIYAVIDHDEGPFAKIRITEVYEMTVEEVVNTTFDGHQNYDSLEHFNERMDQYYDKEFKPSDTVTMIVFEVVEVLD